MIKQATHVCLAVTGHKYPDGERTPGKKAKYTWFINPKTFEHERNRELLCKV